MFYTVSATRPFEEQAVDPGVLVEYTPVDFRHIAARA